MGEIVCAARAVPRPPVKRSETSRSGLSLSIAVALLLGLALAGTLWMSEGSSPSTAPPVQHEPPPLFGDAVACAQNEETLLHARELEQVALAKMERYPFASRDGMKAVRLSAEAQDCYRAAGYANQATRLGRLVGRWRQRLNNDYLGHRLRLKLALQNARVNDALHEVRALRALLSHTQGDHPYSAWLGRLERALADRNRVQHSSEDRGR